MTFKISAWSAYSTNNMWCRKDKITLEGPVNPRILSNEHPPNPAIEDGKYKGIGTHER